MGPAVFHGKAFFPGPEGGAVRVLAIAVKGSVIPAYFRNHIGVGSVIAQPGAVEGAGEGVVLAISVFIPRISDAPFEEEAVDALPVGRIVIAQLKAVVLAVHSIAAVGAMGVPCPETGDVFLLIPEPEFPHPLAKGVHGIPVEGVGVVGAVKKGLRAPVNGALELREVPFRVLRIGVPHHIPHVAAVPDGGRHIPEAPFIQGFPGEGSLFAVIRHQQEVPVAGDLIAGEETPILHLDLPLGAVGGIHHMDLIPFCLAVQVRLHEEQAVPARIVSHFQLLVRGVVLHIDYAPVFMGEAGYGAAAGHIPPGPIGDGEIRGAGRQAAGQILSAFYSRFPTQQGIGGPEFQIDRTAACCQQVPMNLFCPFAYGCNDAFRFCRKSILVRSGLYLHAAIKNHIALRRREDSRILGGCSIQQDRSVVPQFGGTVFIVNAIAPFSPPATAPG